MSKGVEIHRYRISIPDDDEACNSWILNQHNPSLSIRMLIKEQVETNGLGDMFSSSVAPGDKVTKTKRAYAQVASEPQQAQPESGIQMGEDVLTLLPSIAPDAAKAKVDDLTAMLDA